MSPMFILTILLECIIHQCLRLLIPKLATHDMIIHKRQPELYDELLLFLILILPCINFC